MSIRKTVTRRAGKTGHGSCRLARNVREGGRVRQTTLLDPGSDFAAPKPQWRELVATVDDEPSGPASLSEPGPDLSEAADGIVRKLRRQGFAAPTRPPPGPAVETVIDGIHRDDARSAGCERLCPEALSALDFIAILRRQGFAHRDARLARPLVTARMVHPSSEREAVRRLRADSAVLEPLELDRAPSFRPDRPYRPGDALRRCQAGIGDALSARTRTLFDPAGAVIFHDLTNTHPTGPQTSDLARFGRPKRKRHDCPLVTIAGCRIHYGDRGRFWASTYDLRTEWIRVW